MMKDLEESGYKYQGILESDQIKMKEIKKKFTNEYKKRIKLLLESNLDGENVIKAVNTWVKAVLRYSGGILDWNKDEIQNMDRKTRKIMTMNGALHSKTNLARLYLARNEGGRRLRLLEEVVQAEEHGLSDYIKDEENGYNKLLKTLTNYGSKKE